MVEQAAIDRAAVVFSLFDMNGNGHLDREDFELLGQRATEAVPEATEARQDAVHAAVARWWRALSAGLDTDHDGTISRDEFVRGVLTPQDVEAAIDEYADALSTLADPDNDALIDSAVFQRLMLAIGFRETNSKALFEVLDPSGSGYVGVREWADAIREYFHPEKANIAGDRLVPDHAE